MTQNFTDSEEITMLPKVISGTSWVIALIVASLIIRPSYEAVSGYIGTFVTVATIASIGIISLYHFINKRKHIFSKVPPVYTYC